MLRDTDERELRELFHRLREEEKGEVPDFQALMARVRNEASSAGAEPPPRRTGGRRRGWRVAGTGALLAAAAAAAVLLVPRSPEGSDAAFVRAVQTLSADPAMGAWKSPTDALLRLPGDKILSTVPSVDPGHWPLDPEPRSSGNESVRSHS